MFLREYKRLYELFHAQPCPPFEFQYATNVTAVDLQAPAPADESAEECDDGNAGDAGDDGNDGNDGDADKTYSSANENVNTSHHRERVNNPDDPRCDTLDNTAGEEDDAEEDYEDADEDAEEDDDADVKDAPTLVDALEFDDMFVQHSLWMDRFAQMQPSYKDCVVSSREAKDTHLKLTQHLAQKRVVPDKAWSMFEELLKNNNSDVYEKQTKEYEESIERHNTQIQLFHTDLDARLEHNTEWEARIIQKWRHVVHLLPLYGVPLNNHTCKTLQWLHSKEVIPSHYLCYVDAGHYLCSAILPYKNTITVTTLLAHLAFTDGTDMETTTTMRAVSSLHMMFYAYPYLRSWRTSVCAIRTDALLSMLTMWVCDVHPTTILGVGGIVQLYMYLFSNDTKKQYPREACEDGKKGV